MSLFQHKKVHPIVSEFKDAEDSSSESDNNSDNDNENENSKSVKTPMSIDWGEFLEDFNTVLEERRGEKSEMYLLNGDPLKKTNTSGTTGLYVLTEEILTNYGLEMLYMLSDVSVDAMDHRNSWTEVMKQLTALDFKPVVEDNDKKLFIWIDDQPGQEDDPNDSFCRLLMTELLRKGIEPDVMFPCNDMEDEVLRDLSRAVFRLEKDFGGEIKQPPNDDEETTEESELNFETQFLFNQVVPKMFNAVLHLVLAASNCKFVIIDANRTYNDTPEFHFFVDFAKDLGHKILYLRNTPDISDKNHSVRNILTEIVSWTKRNWKQARDTEISQNENGRLPTIVEEPDDSLNGISEAEARKLMIEENMEIKDFDYRSPLSLNELRRRTEIIHKLTPDHFIIQDEDSDSDDYDF